MELEEPDEYDDIEPLEEIVDTYEDDHIEENYGDELYDDVEDVKNQQQTSNNNKRQQLKTPIVSDSGLRKSTKSGPPPPIPSKNKTDLLFSETYEDEIYLQDDVLKEKPDKRVNKLSRRDSSFESENDDNESPERKLPPKPSILPKPSELPSIKPTKKPPPTKPVTNSIIHQKNRSEVNSKDKIQNQIENNSSADTEGQRQSMGKLQLPSKPLTITTPFKPSAPKPMKKPIPPKPVSNLYRADNQSGRSPPRASMPAFPGSLSGELGAALERRRLKSVGMSGNEALDRVETFSKQPRENKMVSEVDKPKFVSILRR